MLREPAPGRRQPHPPAVRLDERGATSRANKWRTFPEDVLPLWVVEMDVPLVEPVARSITQAVAVGDTGYPAGNGYAQARGRVALTSGLGYGTGGAGDARLKPATSPEVITEAVRRMAIT